MATALSAPLYSLEPASFHAAVKALLEAALPNSIRIEELSNYPVKPLQDLISAEGGGLATCPQCRLALPRGSASRMCIACGKEVGTIPVGTSSSWKGSLAEQRFLSSLPLEEDRSGTYLAKKPSMPNVQSAPGNLEQLGRASTPGGSEPAGGASPLSLDALLQRNLAGGGSNSGSASSTPGRSGPGFSAFSKEFFPGSPPGSSGGDPFGDIAPLEPQVTAKLPEVPQEPKAAEATPALKPILNDMQDLSFMLSDDLKLPPNAPSSSSMPTSTPVNNVPTSLSDSLSGEWGDFGS